MCASKVRLSFLLFWVSLFVCSVLRGQTTDVEVSGITPAQAVVTHSAQQAGDRAPSQTEQPNTGTLPQPTPSKTDPIAQVTQRQPMVALVPAPPRKKLSYPPNPNLAYQPDLLDEGFRLESAPLPEASAPVGSRVMVKLAVDSTGSVVRMTYCQGDPEVCKAVAEAASNSWKFSRPMLRGKAVKASATVTVQF